jgi:LysM repeat protein
MVTQQLAVSKNKVSEIIPLLQVWLVKFVAAVVLVGVSFFIFNAGNSVSAQERTVHVVQPGESLSSIARRYSVTVSALARHNGIVNTNLLRVGQRLRIPGNTPPRSYIAPDPAPTAPAPSASPSTSTGSRYYTVLPNDTLYGISARFGVSIEAIKARNGLTTNTIFVGQRLIIP